MRGRAGQRVFILIATIKKGCRNLIINRFFTATVLAGFLFALQLFSSSVISAGEARRLDSDWEAVVKAAKAEGQLAIYANTSFESIFPEFRKKYRRAI